jgi:hypothetical protein
LSNLKVTGKGVSFKVRVLMSDATYQHFMGELNKAKAVQDVVIGAPKLTLSGLLRMELVFNLPHYMGKGDVSCTFDRYTDKRWSIPLELSAEDHATVATAIAPVGVSLTHNIALFFKQLAFDRQLITHMHERGQQEELHKWLHENLSPENGMALTIIHQDITAFMDMYKSSNYPIIKSPLMYWLGNTVNAIEKFLAGKVPEER